MIRRTIVFLLGFNLFLAILLIPEVAAPDILQMEEHEPIMINGNQDLLNTASIEGWSGTGSEQSPIVIRGFAIEGEYHGIRIANVDLNFRIEDCLINGSEGEMSWSFGIILDNCSSASVEGCTIWGFDVGICLSNSNRAFVSRTEVFESFFGVFVNRSSDVWLQSLDIVMCGIGVRLNHTIHAFIEQTIIDHCSYSGIEGISDSGTLLRHNAIIGSEVGAVFAMNENWVFEESAIWSCETGLEASHTNGGFVIRAQISNCSILGIYLESQSTNVSVIENWFGPNNTQNAQDDGAANMWYDELLHIGNYWSDYEGEGPYLIPGSAESVDLYPTSLADAPDWEDIIATDDTSPGDYETSPTTTNGAFPNLETLLIASASTFVVLLVVIVMLRSRVSSGIS